jgi:hypothetical protein
MATAAALVTLSVLESIVLYVALKKRFEKALTIESAFARNCCNTTAEKRRI